MLATELDIKKKVKLYQLKYKNKRKAPDLECIQTPEEMIQYLEK